MEQELPTNDSGLYEESPCYNIVDTYRIGMYDMLLKYKISKCILVSKYN